MLYLVSDIHGNYNRFIRLLDMISFDPHIDHMVILGDVLDRGPDGIKILNYIKPMIDSKAIEMLLGNHEMFCIMYLENELQEQRWSTFGGKDTIEALRRMTKDEKKNLKVFLKGLPLYTQNHSSYLGDFVCVHSGLLADGLIFNADGKISVIKSVEKSYEVDRYGFMCGNDIHYLLDLYSPDKYMIVGHVPCNRLRLQCEIDNYRFYKTARYMDIDAGNGHENGRLGCYVVDTNEEIYVD